MSPVKAGDTLVVLDDRDFFQRAPVGRRKPISGGLAREP